MTQVNSYLAEFSRKSNLSPVYKHKVIKSLRQEIEAKIEGGDTEKDVIRCSIYQPIAKIATAPQYNLSIFITYTCNQNKTTLIKNVFLYSFLT